MKKVIAVLLLVFCLGNYSQAQTDSTVTTTTTTKTTTSTKYFYYPEANVYFNETTNSYTYYDPLTSTWISNTKLPGTFSVNDKSERNLIVYNGKEIWKDNAKHKKEFYKAMKKAAKD